MILILCYTGKSKGLISKTLYMDIFAIQKVCNKEKRIEGKWCEKNLDWQILFFLDRFNFLWDILGHTHKKQNLISERVIRFFITFVCIKLGCTRSLKLLVMDIIYVDTVILYG